VIYRFGPFELDKRAYTLTRSGQPLRVRPKLFDVLLYLIEHCDRVVTAGELLASVWGPEHVTPSVVPWTISRLRQALGQVNGTHAPIETVPRRGYRFVGSLSIDGESADSARAQFSSPAASASSSSGLADPSFIGRGDILQALGSALALAIEGSGSLHLLVGEPGIGRSRCAFEFARHARTRARVWSVGCAGVSNAPRLWPWIEVLRAYAHEEAPGSAAHARVLKLLDELQAEPESDDPGGAAVRMFSLLDRCGELLLESAASQPRLLVLDDLQNADEASLELLARLAPQLPGSRMVVLATLQEPALKAGDPVESPSLHEIRRRASCIVLPAWARSEVESFITQSTRSDRSKELVSAIWQRSGGNPLFAQELLQHHLVHGVTADDSPDPGGVHRNLPEELQRVIRTRLKGLPEDTRSVLATASVVGRSFDLALLQQITQQPAATLLPAIDRAQRLGLIESGTRSAEFRFRYDLIREAIYADLPGGLRASLHLQVGEALENPLFGDVSRSLLAWHFYCAAPLGGAANAVRHAVQAARDARKVAAYADEVRFYEWALEAQPFLDKPDPKHRCELLVALGTAYGDLGETEIARRHLTRAVEIAEARNLPALLAQAAFVLRPSMLLSAMPDPLALHVLEQARLHLPEDATALRSRVASHLACTPPYSERPEQRTALIDEAFELARGSGSATTLFDALRARCQSLTATLELDEVLRWSGEIEALAERTGSPRMLSESQVYRYFVWLHRGDAIDATAMREKSKHSASRMGVRESDWLNRNMAARHDFYGGRLHRAENRIRKLRRERSVRPWLAEFYYAVGMAVIHLERDTAADFWPEFMETAHTWKRVTRTLAGLSLRMLLAQDRIDEVRTEFARIDIERIFHWPHQGRIGILSQLVPAATALGDEQACAVLYEMLLPYARLNAVAELWFSFGSVSHFLGQLAMATGQPDVAQAHFECALQSNAAMGYVTYTAWSRFELGRLLLAGSDASGRERGRGLVKQAETDAREMGLHALLRSIQETPGR
jgi:eukaryotic-like serine/threonine-protein kinase